MKRNILVPGYIEVWPATQTKTCKTSDHYSPSTKISLILKPDLLKNSWSEKIKNVTGEQVLDQCFKYCLKLFKIQCVLSMKRRR